MKERPILFSAPMVRAILAGQKTQTRRVVSDQNSQGNYRASELLLDAPGVFVDPGPSPAGNPGPYFHAHLNAPEIERRRGWRRGDVCDSVVERLYPIWFPGDRLWVRENGWERPDRTSRMIRDGADTWAPYYYDADGLTRGDHEQFKAWGFKRRPSIFMPRWASRITLEVGAVRAERLHAISEDDAKAEGIAEFGGHFGLTVADCWERTARGAFRRLWDSINGKRLGASWDSNPWVWVVEFEREEWR